ncbi:MAG: hypothetical protein CMI09_15860 [Oceanospirillaceae bacterium]|nr:hypothetical protein [Oceanospirillaceae bacterium]|tara:strand:- start:834 stop:1445 length:612 start_codon:yes stop_codon:yes gene_type:complete
MKKMLSFLLCVLACDAFALGAPRVGEFEILGKTWFLVGLTNADELAGGVTVRNGTRLEMKVATDKVSPRRFRQMWLDAMAVAQGEATWATYEQEFDTFFNLVKAPLKQGDIVGFERTDSGVSVTINHYEHANLAHGFLEMMVQSLTARIAPVPGVKQGLLGELPADQQKQLAKAFQQDEISLQRISETSRWLRFPSKAQFSQL